MEKEKLIGQPLHLNGNTLNSKADAVMDDDEQDRHTEEIQDIITRVPSWIIRWGIMVFFGVLLIVVIISAIVRYPDTVKVPLHFQPDEKDVAVITPNSGTIKQSVIAQNAIVKQGQLMAVVQTADGYDLNITSPIGGKAGFAAIIQPGVAVQPQQQLFVVHPVNQHFFGVAKIPAAVSGQVKKGQAVLISLRNENNGRQIKGFVSEITDEPDKDGMFMAKIVINNSNERLKSWITGDAQIMTRDLSIGQRIWNSVVKKL